MQNDDTVTLLTEWGKWSRRAGVRLGSRSAMAVAMQLVEPSCNRVSVNICDDAAMQVEAAVRSLRADSFQASEALRLYFVVGLGEAQVALQMRISLVRAQKLLSRAMGYVDCWLKNIARAA